MVVRWWLIILSLGQVFGITRQALWCQTIIWVTEFSNAPKNHYGVFVFLHSLPLTVAFRLEYVLFYPVYTKVTTFFLSRRFRYGSSLINTFGGNWCQDIKNALVVLHPSCKTTFPSPGQVHGNPSRVCKNDLGLYCLLRPICLNT